MWSARRHQELSHQCSMRLDGTVHNEFFMAYEVLSSVKWTCCHTWRWARQAMEHDVHCFGWLPVQDNTIVGDSKSKPAPPRSDTHIVLVRCAICSPVWCYVLVKSWKRPRQEPACPGVWDSVVQEQALLNNWDARGRKCRTNVIAYNIKLMISPVCCKEGWFLWSF